MNLFKNYNNLVLRKLIKRRKEIDVDKRKREIIEEYANFGSKV